MNRQSWSGILALSSDISVDVPLTAIPFGVHSDLDFGGAEQHPVEGVRRDRSPRPVGASLLQEATKMHALASASATVSCRLFIAPALPIG